MTDFSRWGWEFTYGRSLHIHGLLASFTLYFSVNYQYYKDKMHPPLLVLAAPNYSYEKCNILPSSSLGEHTNTLKALLQCLDAAVTAKERDHDIRIPLIFQIALSVQRTVYIPLTIWHKIHKPQRPAGWREGDLLTADGSGYQLARVSWNQT